MRCPTCGRKDEVPEDFEWRPFCSRRCKMIDLGNWLDEVYRFSRPLGVEDLADEPLSLAIGPLHYLRGN